jgi:hypothetical protein
MKISVITPTIRPESLSVMRDCLKAQTFDKNSFEWLVDINVTGEHDLNASFNRLIKRSSGSLIVFYEDFTKIGPEALQRFWEAHQEHPRTFFTAPLGKVANWGDRPRWDWRSHRQNESQADYTDCHWNTWEIDWGAAPKSALFEIGGFDEELDKYWSADNVNVGKRAQLAGYDFKCLFSNPAVAYDHDLHSKHPFRERYNPAFNNERMAMFERGMKIDFLNSKDNR